MAIPVSKPKIVKKHTKAFLRHDGDKYKRIGWAHKPTWRRPRGIDSRVRRRFKSNTRTVKIGFGTAKAHRHLLPNGLKAFNINNVSDLNMLLLNNREYAAVINHSVSARTRKEIVQRADQLDIRVMNRTARLQTAESQ